MNNNSIISLFEFLNRSVTFSCVIILARMARAMLNRSNASRQFCLAFVLKGKVFNISPLTSICQDTFLSDSCLSASILCFQRFFPWTDVELYQMLYLLKWEDFPPLFTLKWWMTMIFKNITLLLYWWKKTPFDYDVIAYCIILLDKLVKIQFQIFGIYVHEWNWPLMFLVLQSPCPFSFWLSRLCRSHKMS